MARWSDGPYNGGYRDYHDRPPQRPPQQPPQRRGRYPEEEDYDYDYEGGWDAPPQPQTPPYYASPWDDRPPRRQRPPQHNNWQQRPPQGWGARPPRQQSQQRPRDDRPRQDYGHGQSQRQWDNRPQRGYQSHDERPRRSVPETGFNPGTFSLELGDLVKHRTTGLFMSVIRFGREQVECRIHADMSPNWFYESELEFVCHEGEQPPEEETQETQSE